MTKSVNSTLKIKGYFLIYFIDDKLELFFSSPSLPASSALTNENS